MGHDGKNAARITLTVTVDQKKRLQDMAEELDVSMSWLLRRGCEMVLEAKNPRATIMKVSSDA
jgi:predicted transcriptional regulator